MRRSRTKRLHAAYVSHIWAYDFVEDFLADGTPLRMLTVMDEFTREGLAIDVALITSAERVIGVLTAMVGQHGHRHICSDSFCLVCARREKQERDSVAGRPARCERRACSLRRTANVQCRSAHHQLLHSQRDHGSAANDRSQQGHARAARLHT
jgi:hypothetical protein